MLYARIFSVGLPLAGLSLCACNISGALQSEVHSVAKSTQQPQTQPPPTPSVDPSKIVCDPLDPKNHVDPTLGIKASVSYLEDYVVGGPYPVTSSAELRAKGKALDAAVFMSDVKVFPQDFSEGFASKAGSLLKRSDGETLDEWFSIQGETQLQLAAGDDEGSYQFAAIADDGVTLELKPDSAYATFISDESPHNPRMACSTDVVEMKKGQKVPLRFGYYQGPRYRLAFILLWRRVDKTAIPAEVECGKSQSDDFHFSPTSAGFTGITSRGWKVLTPANLLLTDGTNLCAN